MPSRTDDCTNPSRRAALRRLMLPLALVAVPAVEHARGLVRKVDSDLVFNVFQTGLSAVLPTAPKEPAS